MAFTDAEIRELSAPNGTHGWAGVPTDCPPEFMGMILEKRARLIGLRQAAPVVRIAPTPAEPSVDAAAMRERLSAISLF
jgi:hypothetical protein